MRFFSGLTRIRSLPDPAPHPIERRSSSSRLPGLDRRQSCQLSSQPRQTQRRGHKNKSRRAPPALPRLIKTPTQPRPVRLANRSPTANPAYTHTSGFRLPPPPSPKAQGGLAVNPIEYMVRNTLFPGLEIACDYSTKSELMAMPGAHVRSPFGHNASKTAVL